MYIEKSERYFSLRSIQIIIHIKLQMQLRYRHSSSGISLFAFMSLSVKSSINVILIQHSLSSLVTSDFPCLSLNPFVFSWRKTPAAQTQHFTGLFTSGVDLCEPGWLCHKQKFSLIYLVLEYCHAFRADFFIDLSDILLQLQY